MSIEDPISLEQLGKDIRKERLLKDGDACVGICGEEGSGKSTVMIILGLAIDPKGFDVERNIVYSPDHNLVRRKIMEELEHYSAFGVDEAVTVAYKRFFQMKSQILMNVTYTQCRNHNIASLFCMPDFFSFDKFWRDHRLKIWIQLLDRTHGIIFSKDWNPFTTDKWNMKFNEKYVIDYIGRKKVHEIDMEKRIEILLKSKNCVGWFSWESLEGTDIWQRYLELKNAAKRNIEFQDVLTGQNAKTYDRLVRSVGYMSEIDKLTLDKIGSIINAPHQTVAEYVKKHAILKSSEGRKNE
jgi:ABC-type dipeptide/oligopeptide/nickel transport system ATPase component